MRVVFMGTPQFSVPSLEAIAREHQIVAVYTRPDAASGRGAALHPSPVKAAALELGLEVRTPVTLRDPQAFAQLEALAPSIIVVVAYGVILPDAVLSLPKHGCINAHASLLPRWRGAAPIQRAILAGDEQTGVTIMRVTHTVDSGAGCVTLMTPIANKRAEALQLELAQLSASGLLEGMRQIEEGTVIWTEQDESLVTYADKIEKPEMLLDPQDAALVNLRRVKASTPAAPARAVICGKPVTVLDAHLGEATAIVAGEVCLIGGELMLGTAQHTLIIDEIKPDGKKAMPACAWVAGLRCNDDMLTWGVIK